MARARSAGTVAVVVASLVLPLIAGAVLVVRAAAQSPLESASAAAPLMGKVESAERSRDTQVAIAVEFADAIAPTTASSGVVTSLEVAPGDRVVTGTTVATVNDRRLVAYNSDSPLFRDISRGSTGRDVATAQALLATLGFGPGLADGEAGPATERAIIAFNEASGYGDKNPVLSLASLVWMGAAPVTVANLNVATGDVVSPGDELLTTASVPAAITVTENATVPRDAELELVVGDVTAPYAQGSGRVTEPAAVAAIAASLGAVVEAVGTVRLVRPESVATVPASAVISDAEGRICLFRDLTGAPLAIIPLGGTLGTIDLEPSLAGQPVLLNPRGVRDDLTCAGS